MFLHLLRHAHAGDPERWDGPDAGRPLSPKGRAQAEALGAYLAAIGFTTDALITSPKVRARETAEIVAEQLGLTIAIDDRLGGGPDLRMIEAILDDAGHPAAPVLVGHDPDLSDLVAELCGPGSAPMRKGALARIETGQPVRPGSGTLRWLLPPDAIRPGR
ncbi:MAG: SixA phosphatase family protein [Candidatus Limnocylindrales bacterium]